MARRKKIFRQRRRVSGASVAAVISVVAIAAVSFPVAALWQSLSRVSDPIAMLESSSSQAQAPAGESDAVQAESEESTASAAGSSDSEASSSQAASEASSQQEEQQESRFAYPEVEESDMAPSSYFDDALFIGDSITTGIELYDVMSNAQVIAFTGINPQTYFTREVIELEDGSTVTMEEAVRRADNPGKIYVMMGSNGVAFLDIDTFTDYYGQMLDSIMEAQPDADIYVQSITPVTATLSASQPAESNEKINEYNARINQLAGERGLYFVDVNKALADETGALPEDASPADGMHFTSAYYQKWLDYLRKHTAESSL